MNADDRDFENNLMVRKAESDFRDKAESLKKDCEYLIRKLTHTIQNCDLALEGKPWAISSLGEVQGAGLDIDRACAELRLLSDMIGLAKRATKRQ
ncbi:MAG: hypothetical protein HYS13_07555 [Planctomycetia bacterium]|nr:hypothetical protein [Planctomycetia bacterium]